MFLLIFYSAFATIAAHRTDRARAAAAASDFGAVVLSTGIPAGNGFLVGPSAGGPFSLHLALAPG